MLKEANTHFCPFGESDFSNICTLFYAAIECIGIDRLRKHRKKFGSGQLLFQ